MSETPCAVPRPVVATTYTCGACGLVVPGHPWVTPDGKRLCERCRPHTIAGC